MKCFIWISIPFKSSLIATVPQVYAHSKNGVSVFLSIIEYYTTVESRRPLSQDAILQVDNVIYSI